MPSIKIITDRTAEISPENLYEIIKEQLRKEGYSVIETFEDAKSRLPSIKIKVKDY